MDWTITVPFKVMKFKLILKAAQKPVSACMFWKMLLGDIALSSFKAIIEKDIGCIIDLIIGMGGWFYIMKELFMRKAGGVAGICSQVFEGGLQTKQLRTTCTCASTWCKCASSPHVLKYVDWTSTVPLKNDQIQLDLEGCAKASVGMKALKSCCPVLWPCWPPVMQDRVVCCRH